MDNLNDKNMVTIPLGEYNRLRDDADLKKLLIDRVMTLEVIVMDMSRKINDLHIRKADK